MSHRSEKNGNHSGMKQDKYRHSRFDQNTELNQDQYQSQSSSANTLGGKWEENRGHHSASERTNSQNENPFENGKLRNWNHRKNWNQSYSQYTGRSDHSHGGSLKDNGRIDHSGKGPKGYNRPDESVFEDVCEALTMSPEVDASDIEVSVRSGIVTLRGQVHDRSEKKWAELVIENVSGVHDVQNLLMIS